MACKTADGTVDGVGAVIGDSTKDYRSLTVPTDGIQVGATNDARYGKILAGPEYFTIFDGLTGAARATTEYIPSREPIGGWGGIGGNGNNDTNGNRGDRMLAAVAYLDGHLPSVVGVSSNEPIDGDDDGQTSPDWIITGPLTVDLRAERSGIGTGRIYTIEVEASDAAANKTRQSVTVLVPLKPVTSR